MNFRAFNLSQIQMTISLVILCQIFSTTYMFPMSSPYRKSELDLLLDPIHQAEQDELESKKVVAKSVYHTPLRQPTDAPCESGTRRASTGGPCLKINSSQGPALDEKYLSSILKDLGKQGRPRRPSHSNRNRNRGSTTNSYGRRTTTTEIPPSDPAASTLHDLEGSSGDGDIFMMDLTSTIPTYITEADPDQISETQQPEIYSFIPTPTTVMTTLTVVNAEEIGQATQISTVNDENGSSAKNSSNAAEKHNSEVINPPINGVDNTIPTILVNSSNVTRTTESPQGINFTTPILMSGSINASSPYNDKDYGMVITIQPHHLPVNLTLNENDAIRNGVQANFEVKKPSEQPVTILLNQKKNVTTTLEEKVLISDVTNNSPLNSTVTSTINYTSLGIVEEDAGLSLYNLTQEESDSTMMTPINSQIASPIITTGQSQQEELPEIKPTVALDEKVTSAMDVKTDEETNKTDEPAAAGSSSTILALADQTLKRLNYSDNSMTDMNTLLPDGVGDGITAEDVLELDKITTLALTPRSFQNVKSTTASSSPTLLRNSSKSPLFEDDDTPVATTTSSIITPAGEIQGRMMVKIKAPEIDQPFLENGETEQNDEESTNPTTDVNESLKFDEATTLDYRIMENFQEPVQERETFIQPQLQPNPQEIRVPFSRRRIPEFSNISQEDLRVQSNTQQTHLQTNNRPEDKISRSSHEVETEIDQIHQRSRTKNRIRNPDFSENFQDEILHGSHDLLRNRQDQSSHVSRSHILLDPVTSQYPKSQFQFASFDYLKSGDNYRRFRVF